MKLTYRQGHEHKLHVVASHSYNIYENNEHVGEFALLFTGKTVSLWGLQIFEPHRRKGYAKKLLEGIIKALKQQGRHTLALYVKSDNFNARPLYLNLGFKQIPQEDSTSIYMELDLTTPINIGNLPHFNDCKEIEI